MFENNTNYQDMNQGIDRITDILRRQSTPVASSPIASQASPLPVNILNALQAGSTSYGSYRRGGFMNAVQEYETNQQNQELNQQKMLLQAYDAKLKMGDAQAKALDDKLTLFTGNDPEGKAMFLEALHTDPEQIDPSNSYQIMTKLAGIKKKMGYESPDLRMAKEGAQLDLDYKRSQINANNSLIKERSKPDKDALSFGVAPPAAANTPDAAPAPRPVLRGGMPYTDGLEKGSQWGMDSTGNYVAMAIPSSGGGMMPSAPERMTVTLNTLKDAYNELHTMGADISTDNSILKNKTNQLKLSEGFSIGGVPIIPSGQSIMKGSKSQAVVDKIGANISGLLLDIKAASGAGAKQFDSDRDVIFMTKQASNPTNDFGSNLEIMNRLAVKYTGKPLPDAPAQDSGFKYRGVKKP